MITLEVCANSLQSALNAQQGGASRIELCDNLYVGGTTPAFSHISLARNLLDIDLNVLIRPRGGDFVYSDIEFQLMKIDIEYCGSIGYDGIVFGILKSDYTIDKKRCEELVDLARHYGMSVTFHRAFDYCKDLYVALDEIISLGINRLLTSGGEATAFEGRYIISDLIDRAGDVINIMPGGGINEDNISDLVRCTHLKEFHGSFQEKVSCIPSPAYQTDYFMETSTARVSNVIDITNNCL